MRIDVKGRNLPVSDDLEQRVHKRFAKVGRQVSPLARLQVELVADRQTGKDPCCVEATLELKGVTLRASARAADIGVALNRCEEDLGRQVKRTADKRRARRSERDRRTISGPQVQPGL